MKFLDLYFDIWQKICQLVSEGSVSIESTSYECLKAEDTPGEREDASNKAKTSKL